MGEVDTDFSEVITKNVEATFKRTQLPPPSLPTREVSKPEDKTTPADVILNEYSRKLQEVKYRDDLMMLPFDGSKIGIGGEKDFYFSNLSEIVWDPRFNPDTISDNDMNSIVSKIHELAQTYQDTCRNFGFSSDQFYVNEPRAEGLKNTIENKRRLVRLLEPGNYVAHGSYIGNLPNIIKLGGLTSSMGRVNAGQINKMEIPRWKGTMKGHPHKSAVFFYPWTNPKAGTYASSFYQGEGNVGSTDLSIIYPTEDLVENAGAILVESFHDDKNLEIGVTNSPTSVRAGKLVDGYDDTTLLPLEKAFLIIPKDREKSVRELMLSNGYSSEWVDSHVKSLQIATRSDPNFGTLNDMGEVILAHKDEINDWLQQHTETSGKKISIGSNTGNLEGLFTAKLN